MKKSILMEKYPVYTLELQKSEVKQTNVTQIVEYFKEKIENHKIAKFVGIFDHYTHTADMNGPINPAIKDAQNILFCFGPAIPNTQILAVRPRSIGICELEDRFTIDFLEAPKEQLHELMETWAKDLRI